MALSQAAGAGRVKDRRLRRPLVCLDSAGCSGYSRGLPKEETTVPSGHTACPRRSSSAFASEQASDHQPPNEAFPAPVLAPAPEAGSRPRNSEALSIGLTRHHTGCQRNGIHKRTPRAKAPSARPTRTPRRSRLAIIRVRLPAVGSRTGAVDRGRSVLRSTRWSNRSSPTHPARETRATTIGLTALRLWQPASRRRVGGARGPFDSCSQATQRSYTGRFAGSPGTSRTRRGTM